MNKFVIMFGVLALVLAGCGPSKEEKIQTAIAQTETARPTATITLTPTGTNTPTETSTPTPEHTLTPTLIPLSQLSLKYLFNDTTYMPTGYSYGQISHSVPGHDDFPPGVNEIDVRFAKNNEISGGTSIILYDNPEDANKAFEISMEGMGDKAYLEEGDNFRYASKITIIGDFKFTSATMLYCNTAYIYSLVSGLTNRDAVGTYMVYIANALKPYVCEQP
jgi:hypothetical protein